MKTWPRISSPPKRHLPAATVDGVHMGLYWSQNGVEKWTSKRSPPAWAAAGRPDPGHRAHRGGHRQGRHGHQGEGETSKGAHGRVVATAPDFLLGPDRRRP